jgi:hypothetical protein
MNQGTTKVLGRQLTAGWLCGLIVFNAAMFGCSGAPGETSEAGETGRAEPAADQVSKRTQTAVQGDVASAEPIDSVKTVAASTPAARAILSMSLDQMTSRLAVDAAGLEYETQFERLAQQLLIKEASDQLGFMASLEKAFGPGYDQAKAEEIRQQILSGDFSWAPQVRIVSEESLSGAFGAYEPNTGTVYVSAATTSKFERTFIYLEELGHHLDTLLNAADAPGDEGALFRIALTRQVVDQETLALMHTDQHVGTMLVDGQMVEVEFFFLVDWIKAAANATWNGLKTAGGYIWKGATTAGGAIRTAANATWNGAQVLKGWVARGADAAADAFVASLNRDFWAAYHTVNGAVNVLLTVGHGTLDGIKVIQQGITELSKGNLIDGTAAIFTGLAKIAVEMPIDTIATATLDAITVLQTALFLEPVGRGLTARENEFLSWVFGGQWWLPLIRVKVGFAGIYSVISPDAFTSQFNIYLKDNQYTEALMVHETTHVWQWANGGGDYKLESLQERASSGQGAYVWEPAVNAGVPWTGLGVEQQAAFVEDAYAWGCYEPGNYNFSTWSFNWCWINGDRTAYFNNVDQNIWAGVGAP